MSSNFEPDDVIADSDVGLSLGGAESQEFGWEGWWESD